MIKKNGNFDFKNLKREISQFKRIAPKVVANMAVNHFLDGFQKGGGQTDASRSGWRPRKAKSIRNSGRAILVDTGNMRDDIRVKSATFNNTVVGTTRIPYAVYHNKGTARLPQREFIGDSIELEQKIEKELNKMLKKIK